MQYLFFMTFKRSGRWISSSEMRLTLGSVEKEWEVEANLGD